MPSFSQRDLFLLIGASAGIVAYYKLVKPMIDKHF